MRILFATLVACLWAGTAAAQQACGPRDVFTQALKEQYKEVPRAMALTSAGTVLEIFVSPEGTYTALIIQPDGIACMASQGTAWNFIPEPVEGRDG